MAAAAICLGVAPARRATRTAAAWLSDSGESERVPEPAADFFVMDFSLTGLAGTIVLLNCRAQPVEQVLLNCRAHTRHVGALVVEPAGQPGTGELQDGGRSDDDLGDTRGWGRVAFRLRVK